MSIKSVFLHTAAAILLATLSVIAAAVGPSEQVKITVDAILEIISDSSLDWAERQARIENIVDRRFDFRTMSQSVLARNWQRATPTERERFVEFFSQYLEHTYMEKLKEYTDQSVRYANEKIREDRAEVATFIVTDTGEIPVTYRLRKDSGEWFAYDVVIEGVSLVSNYRSVYAVVVKDRGISGLLDDLKEQINRYESAQQAEPPR